MHDTPRSELSATWVATQPGNETPAALEAIGELARRAVSRKISPDRRN